MATPSFIAPSSPMDRRRLGKFEVLCRLSTGGMSEIYLAHQTGLAGFNKLVVLKTILPDIGGEEDFVRMFLDEARTTAAFNHPNIAQVYELDTDDGQLFMAMEFVQGCTLVEMARACRQAKEPIPIGFTLAAVRDTALALHYAHNFTDARGRKQIVIHRDVAEKNIMVTYEGVTKLLDFGIAKALGRAGRTSVGMVKGTSGYMSPEQIRGEPLDGRSDIFALGVVAHECLTGLRLFHGKSAEEGMMAALKENVVPPSKWNPQVPPAVDAVVLKALQRDREARFGTALEFAREIDKVSHGLVWHPEQSGELVMRFFTERRAETRRLLEAAMGQETTGEIRVKSIIQKVRASVSTPAVEDKPLKTDKVDPAPVPSTPRKATGSLPPLTAAPPQAAPPSVPESTSPGVHPTSLRHEPSTAPARPKVLRAEPAVPSVPGRTPVDVGLPRPAGPTTRPPRNEFDDDDQDAKTIPAAALPDEIRALRARMAEAAAAKKAASAASSPTLPPVSSRPSRPGTPAPTDERPVPRDSNTTDPQRPQVSAVTDANPALKPKGPDATDRDAETLSGSSNAAHTTDWDDDDDVGARTTIATPGEVLGNITKRSNDDLRATQDYEGQSIPSLPEAPSRGRWLVVALVLLALLAIAGVLVLLEVIPLGTAEGAGAEPPAAAAGAAGGARVEPARVEPATPPPAPAPAPAPTPAPTAPKKK